jgi:hypothetical protein
MAILLLTPPLCLLLVNVRSANLLTPRSAIAEKRGLHSGKEGTVPKLVNGSEVRSF